MLFLDIQSKFFSAQLKIYSFSITFGDLKQFDNSMENFTQVIAKSANWNEQQVANTIKLLEEGATIPFISRYRKEMTGSMDEEVVGFVKDELKRLNELEKRRESIIKSIAEQGKLTDDLKEKILRADNITELEDLYLPYKQKKKTRATIAKEKGLEPLAVIVMKQQEADINGKAESFLNSEVASVEDALKGARDIIAEWITENKRARNAIRRLYEHEAVISTKVAKGKEVEGAKFNDYFDFAEPLKKCASHRLLAMRRGEEEGFLKLSLAPDEQQAIDLLDELFIKGYYDVVEHVRMAIRDSYKRLLQPSIENEFRALSKDKADEVSIGVFSKNLRQLLMGAPLGEKRTLAIDPGFRSGCKVVCVDNQGNLLNNCTIFPHAPQNDRKKAQHKLSTLVEQYKIEAIAIGNGTASRETENLVKSTRFDREVQVFVVSEAGASVYSASKVAREEFPEYDVTVRGAVSIGRRLMDPLAELVKIDPKSIGVGQYQHDVDQGKLKDSLDKVVESCVNAVGVDLNTASKHLLTYVSGLGPQLAQNIVEYRKDNGAFLSRAQLKKVPRLGPKAFEQAAGFLRIRDAKNPLDNSAVHPESYTIVTEMAKDLSVKVHDLMTSSEIRNKIILQKYVSNTVGVPTLKDITEELAKPGRDPRTKIKMFEFAEGIHKIEDVKEGMTVPGIVTNITNFGAFVDIGVKQDGLVHISQLADRFISDPNDIVSLHDHVKVKVVEVDIARKRIQLSMKEV